jgi:hypothetical protein
MKKIIKDINGLSSGTLATISGLNKYTDLDNLKQDFVDFTIKVLKDKPTVYKSWQEAWKEFKQVSTIK